MVVCKARGQSLIETTAAGAQGIIGFVSFMREQKCGGREGQRCNGIRMRRTDRIQQLEKTDGQRICDDPVGRRTARGDASDQVVNAELEKEDGETACETKRWEERMENGSTTAGT